MKISFFETQQIGIAVSGDRNVIKREAEQFLKYGEFNGRNRTRVTSKTRSDPGNNTGATGTVS